MQRSHTSHSPAATQVTRRRLLAAGAAAVSGLHAAPGMAQTALPPPPVVLDPKLVALARGEGSLTLYGSMAETDLQFLVDAFKARYGIDVNVWRSGKNKVLQRATAELRAGKRGVDIVHNPSPEMEAFRLEGGLLAVHSPVQEALIAQALPAHREWTGLRVYLFAVAYNTGKVTPQELPKRWEDLLDPRWKGRLGIEAKDQEWFSTWVKAMGERRGIKLLTRIAATNGLSVRNGHALLNNMVSSGEVPLALATYSYLPEQARRRGAPVNWFVLPPAIAYTDGIGVARHAPHPNAARLFFEFALTEGLALLAQRAHITTQRSSESVLKPLQPVFIDPASVLVDYDKWTSIYEAAVAGRGT